jgi:hypothetical protein
MATAITHGQSEQIAELERAFTRLSTGKTDLFNGALDGAKVVITIKPAGRRKGVLGLHSTNAYGLRRKRNGHLNEISITAEESTRNKPGDTSNILETLIHEMTHEAARRLERKDGRPPYHNLVFKELAEAATLECYQLPGLEEKYGWAFTRMTDATRKAAKAIKFNYELFSPKRLAVPKPLTAPTKMLKWECGGCERPMIIRCAREVNATCNDCGTRFERA